MELRKDNDFGVLETQNMCSSVGNEAGEMCSPVDADTRGVYNKDAVLWFRAQKAGLNHNILWFLGRK